jgi:hypothetical protein
LPDLDHHAPAMLQIMQRPDFVRSTDARADLKRAHRLAEIFETDKLRSVEKAKRARPVDGTGLGPRAAAIRTGLVRL